MALQEIARNHAYSKISSKNPNPSLQSTTYTIVYCNQEFSAKFTQGIPSLTSAGIYGARDLRKKLHWAFRGTPPPPGGTLGIAKTTSSESSGLGALGLSSTFVHNFHARLWIRSVLSSKNLAPEEFCGHVVYNGWDCAILHYKPAISVTIRVHVTRGPQVHLYVATAARIESKLHLSFFPFLFLADDNFWLFASFLAGWLLITLENSESDL